MKNYFKNERYSLIFGIVVFWVLYSIQALLGNFISAGNPETSVGISSYITLLLWVISSSLLLTLPGYLAGWFARGIGAINALFVVTFCFVIQSFISINFKGFTFDIFHLSISLVTPGIVSIVSGEAGQYHRKIKKRL